MTSAEARVELAVALHIARDGRTWAAASRETGMGEDVLMALEGVWQSRRRVLFPQVVEVARAYRVPLADLLPGSALRSGPVRRFRWHSGLRAPDAWAAVRKGLRQATVDLHRLYQSETNTIRRRYHRLLTTRPDVVRLAMAAELAGHRLADWLPPEWQAPPEADARSATANAPPAPPTPGPETHA